MKTKKNPIIIGAMVLIGTLVTGLVIKKTKERAAIEDNSDAVEDGESEE